MFISKKYDRDYRPLTDLMLRWSAIHDSAVSTTVSGEIVSVSNAKAKPLEKLAVAFSPIQASGTPSPDNVLPISGWSGVNAWVSGTNVWDEEWEVGGFNSSGELVNESRIRSKNYISVVSGASYYVVDPTNGDNVRLYYFDADKTYVSNSGWVGNEAVTIPDGVAYVKFTMAISYGTTYLNNISISFPASQTSYVATKGITAVSEDFGQTYYGGSVDLVSGVMTVTHVAVTLDGTQELGTYSGGADKLPLYYPALATKTDGNGVSNCLVVTSRYATLTGNSGYFRLAQNGIAFHLDGFKGEDWTIADLNAYLAENPITFVYELATPLTVQLTAHSITAPAGDMVVWSDADGVEVTYKASAS